MPIVGRSWDEETLVLVTDSVCGEVAPSCITQTLQGTLIDTKVLEGTLMITQYNRILSRLGVGLKVVGKTTDGRGDDQTDDITL